MNIVNIIERPGGDFVLYVRDSETGEKRKMTGLEKEIAHAIAEEALDEKINLADMEGVS